MGSDAAITAKAIKKRITAMYPDVKFSVRSEVYSMGLCEFSKNTFLYRSS